MAAQPTTVVVTGASGFLGQAVLDALRARAIPAVPVARQPLDEGVQVAHYGETPSGEVLIHLAEDRDRANAKAGGKAYERAAAEILASLLDKGYRRVIYASSAVLYGDGHETARNPYSPVVATDAYTRVKLVGERAVFAVDGVVARLANLYGPGMAPGNVVSNILDQIPGEGPLSVMDDTPVRDFLWVDDAAEALAAMAATGMTAPDHHGIYNVGTGVGTSIGELARLALTIGECPGRPVIATKRSKRPSCIILDVSNTAKTWEWNPRTPLRQGLSILLNQKTRS